MFVRAKIVHWYDEVRVGILERRSVVNHISVGPVLCFFFFFSEIHRHNIQSGSEYNEVGLEDHRLELTKTYTRNGEGGKKKKNAPPTPSFDDKHLVIWTYWLNKREPPLEIRRTGESLQWVMELSPYLFVRNATKGAFKGYPNHSCLYVRSWLPEIQVLASHGSYRIASSGSPKRRSRIQHLRSLRSSERTVTICGLYHQQRLGQALRTFNSVTTIIYCNLANKIFELIIQDQDCCLHSNRFLIFWSAAAAPAFAPAPPFLESRNVLGHAEAHDLLSGDSSCNLINAEWRCRLDTQNFTVLGHKPVS